MARTDVTINSVGSFFAGGNLTRTTGVADGMAIDATGGPVMLLMINSNVATVAVTLEAPASNVTLGQAQSVAHTIPAAAGGNDGVRAIMLDFPAARQSTGKYNIDTVDANIGDVDFLAIRWTPTRV